MLSDISFGASSSALSACSALLLILSQHGLKATTFSTSILPSRLLLFVYSFYVIIMKGEYCIAGSSFLSYGLPAFPSACLTILQLRSTLIVDFCPCGSQRVQIRWVSYQACVGGTNQYVHCPAWNLDGNPSDAFPSLSANQPLRLSSMFRVTGEWPPYLQHHQDTNQRQAKHYTKHSVIPSKD